MYNLNNKEMSWFEKLKSTIKLFKQKEREHLTVS